MQQIRIRISNITFLKKRVKDYHKPIRFTVTLAWEDEQNLEHGVDIIGCLGGIGRDGKPSWNGPAFALGVKPSFNAVFAPGTYAAVLEALSRGGYFKSPLEAFLREKVASQPTPADEEDPNLSPSLDVH